MSREKSEDRHVGNQGALGGWEENRLPDPGCVHHGPGCGGRRGEGRARKAAGAACQRDRDRKRGGQSRGWTVPKSAGLGVRLGLCPGSDIPTLPP